MIENQDFLFRINQIAGEEPKYAIGHDGSDGQCDCIGLIKGAIRRAGGTPSGLSGTNYAARHTIKGMTKLTADSQLKIGDVVLKSREPGETGYDLPDKYRTGGKECNGDLKDYYHIGVVTGVSPLRITHMTTPTAKVDVKLGKWNWFGTLPHVEKGSDGGEQTVTDMITATVATPNNGPVNVRAGSGTSFKRVDRINCGETVKITTKGDRWSKVEYAIGTRMIVGWISNDYLIFGEETPASSETIKITLTVDQARAMLAGLEALEDQIVDRIGRG